MTIGLAIETACPATLRPYLSEVKASPLVLRLSRGAFWSLAGALLSRGLALLGAVAVARVLGKQGFGELGVIQNTVNTFQVFAGFGLGATATRYVAQWRAGDPERAGRIMALSGVTSLVTGLACAAALFLAAAPLASGVLAAPQLAGSLRIGAGLLFFASLNGAQTGALVGLEAFRAIARLNLVNGLLTLVLMVAGNFLAGLQGILWGLLLTAALTWLLTHFRLRKEAGAARIAASIRGCWSDWRVLRSYSLPAVLAGLIVAVATWASGAMLVNQPGGYADMGVYNAFLRIKQVPEGILAALLAPILPVLSAAHGSRDIATFRKATRYAFAVSIAIVVPLALLQIAVPGLSDLPYGPKFHGYPGVVRWLMLQAATVGVCYPIGILQASVGRMWLGAVYNFSWAAVLSLLAWILVPSQRGAGLAAALAGAGLLTVVPATVYLYRRERIFFQDTPFWKLLFGTLVLSGACWLAGSRLQPATAAAAGAMAAVASLSVAYSLVRRNSFAR